MVDSALYRAVNSSVGLFDASKTYGRLFARGKDALDLLHRMSTNDIAPLESGSGAVLTALLNEKGRFIDVLKVVRDSSGATILIASKDKEQAIVSWLDKFTIMEDARFISAADAVAQFLVCGPKAKEILTQFTSESLDNASRANLFDLQLNSVPATLVKAPSLAGEGWFVLTATENAETVWNELSQFVASNSGVMFDEELFELLRIENGTPIAPNEINDKHNPLELPLASEVISFTKGCYIGQEVIARLDAQDKVQRKLVGLKFSETMPNAGDKISIPSLASTALGDEIGDVTSIAVSPRFGNVGLGYVRGKHANPETKISVKSSEGHSLPATIVQLPFHV